MPPSRQRGKVAAQRLAPAVRQDQILDSTLAVTARGGYGNATMQSIAREAGVTRPVVYEFYRDRTELLQDLLARESQKALSLAESVFAFAQQGETLTETMAWTMTEFLRIVAIAPETWRLLLLPPAGAPAEVRDAIDSARAAILAQMRLNLLELPGASAPGFDAELLAFTLLSGCEVAARALLSEPQTFDRVRLSEAVAWIAEHIEMAWTP